MSTQCYKIADCASFRKTSEQFGALSNMCRGFPLVIDGKTVWSSEALYQSYKFPDEPVIRDAILRERNPKYAKNIAERYAGIARRDWKTVRVTMMWRALGRKVRQHPDAIRAILQLTGDNPIVEDSPWDTFWGCERVGDNFVGENVLGRLWMIMRTMVMTSDLSMEMPPPFVIDDMLAEIVAGEDDAKSV